MEVCGRTKLLSLNAGDIAEQLGRCCWFWEKMQVWFGPHWVEEWPGRSLEVCRSLQARGEVWRGAGKQQLWRDMGADGSVVFLCPAPIPSSGNCASIFLGDRSSLIFNPWGWVVVTSHWLCWWACDPTLANQSTASLSTSGTRDKAVIHGQGRAALLSLGLPSWWKGSLKLLVAVATGCLRIKPTWEGEREREMDSSSHLFDVGLQPSWEPDVYPRLPVWVTHDLTLTVKGSWLTPG